MSGPVAIEITIDASADAVWRALTDDAELVRWLPVDARLVPGAGGSIWMSWGDTEGSAPITGWDRGSCLQWTEDCGRDTRIVTWSIDARGATTIVRLQDVSSDPSGPHALADRSRAGGWRYFLQHLKWYIERHLDQPRQMTVWRDIVTLRPADAFARLIGLPGLSSDGVLLNAAAGQPYQTSTVLEDEISGIVLMRSRSTHQLGMTITELGDAILFIEIESDPGVTRAGFWLSTYSLDPDTLRDLRRRYGRLYRNALGLEAG